jgi:MFS family permease
MTTTLEPPVRQGRLPSFLHSRFGGMPRAFWVLLGGTFINRLGFVVQPYLAFYLSSVRGLSLAETGTVISAGGVGMLLSDLIGGSLTDRFGRRSTVAGGMLANGVALIALAYVRGLADLILVTFAFGLSLNIHRPAASALIADIVPEQDRRRAYGLRYWVVNLGFSAAMVFGGLLSHTGFVWLFWVDAGTGFIFGLLAWLMVPDSGPRERKGEAGGFRDVLRDPLMVGFVLLMLIWTTVYMQSFTTFPLAMHFSGLPPSAYGMVIALNGILIVLIQPLAGNWLVSQDHGRLLAWATVVLGIGFGLTAFAHAIWGYGAAVVVWTLGEIIAGGVPIAVVTALAPAHLRGRYNGLYGLAYSIGWLVAPTVGTLLLSHGRMVLWFTCAGACVLAALGQVAIAPAIRRRGAA